MKTSQLDCLRIVVVIKQVGLTKEAHRKVGNYSTGMKQRLKLTQALLPEPQVS